MKILVRKFVLLGVLALSFGFLKGQNAIIGNGFAYSWNWDCLDKTHFVNFVPSVHGTYILETTPNNNNPGDRYFRLAVDWDFGGTIRQLATTLSSDEVISIGTKYQLLPSCNHGGTMIINAPSGYDNYIFKTKDAGTNPSGEFVVFRVQGDVRNVTSVSQFPAIVPDGQAVTITATMSAAFATGQSAYLRYTLDDFATSVVVPMTGSTTAPTAEIPASAQGQTVKYYVFTSGSGLTIPGSDADLFTINYNTNGGSNYSYQVQAAGDFFLFDSFQRTTYGDVVGEPSSNPDSPWLEYETTVTGARTMGGGLYMSAAGSDREMISFDMSNHYPAAFDQSTDTMRWAWNMRSDRDTPGGFANGQYGSAFILGSNQSNFTHSDAYGYAVVVGGGTLTGTERPLRLIRFKNGLTSNAVGTIQEIATIPLQNDRSYLNIKVLYNSCDHTWVLKLREDTVFTQPNIGAFPLSATGTDATYTSSDIPHLGVLWNHGTLDHFLRIDNIYIPSPTLGYDVEYIWTGATSDFNLPSNWSPSRGCARHRDRLIFETEAYNVTAIPNQIIGQLIVRNNATVKLRNALSQQVSTLNLTGGTGGDFVIESGSTLNFNSMNGSYTTEGIVLNMNTSTTGEILGVLQFDNDHSSITKSHQLVVKDSDALHVKYGGRVEAIHLLNGNNPFGTGGSIPGVAVFESGSTYLHASGGSPFGDSGSVNKVIFEPGSWYHFTYTGNTLRMAGLSYANFKYDLNNSKNLAGINAYSIDTLTVKQGTLNFKLDATGTIAGDIEVVSGATLNFTPTSGTAQIVVDAPVVQNIYGDGNLTFGTGTTLKLQNQNRINIQKNIAISGTGPANILPNAVVAFEEEFGFTGNGNTDIQNNSTVYVGSVNGITTSGGLGNVRTTGVRTYSGQAAYIYNGIANQNTGNGLPTSLTTPGRIEIDNPGTVTLTTTNTTTPKLTLSNGLFALGGKVLGISNDGEIISTAPSNFASGALAGTVEFKGAGTVSATGDLDFWNVNLVGDPGGVNFGATGTPNIKNELVINAGQWINTNAPFYADGSTLVYNTGGTYGAGDEWAEWEEEMILDSRGIPHHVQIGKSGVANSKVVFGTGSEYRYCTGDVTIGHGASSGYELNLGGEDLKLDGDFTLNVDGNFVANNKAVFFLGATDQTISSYLPSQLVSFDYMVIDKSGGNLLISDIPNTTVNLNGLNGNLLVLSNGDFDLQGQTLNLGTLNTNGYLLVQNGDRTIKSDNAANFSVHGIMMEVAGSLSGALKFDNNVTVNISSGMNFGENGLTTINATLQINAGGFASANAPLYGPDGILRYNTGANPYLRRVEWSGTEGNPGFPNDVIVAGNTVLNPGGDPVNTNTGTAFGARRNVTIESGSAIYMDYGSDDMNVALKVGADLTINGSLSASDVDGGDIHVGGNWVRNTGGVFNPKDRQVLFNGTTPQTITAVGGETFDYLGFENSGTKDLLSNITVNKKIEFYSGTGALSGDGQTIKLLGDWDNQAGETAFAEAGTTVSFEGSTLQNVDCAVSTFEGFHNLTMNNSSSGVKLNNSASIYGNLQFVDGLIEATISNRVDFQPGSTNSGASQSSYINGFASKTGFTAGVEFMFPVGQYIYDPLEPIDVYQPAGLIPISSSSTARFAVDYNHQSFFPGAMEPNNLPPMQSPLQKASTCNYWNINKEVAGTDARVRLYWNEACLDINDPNSLVVAKVVGDEWVDQGPATATSVSPYLEGSVVTTNALSSFSPFTIASSSNINVLPIQLLSFTATPKNQTVETNWTTSTESNNDFFTVERSADAREFEAVGRVEGAGNSTTPLSYSFTDASPFAGISYYRLKQTDFDGKSTYSEIRAVQIDSDNRFELLNVYRSDDGVNLVYRSEVEVLKVEIFDLVGKRLFADEIRNETGLNTIQPSLVRGIYLLRLSNGVEMVSRKFFY